MTTSLRSKRRLVRRGLALATGTVLALGAALATQVAPAAAADPARNGIVCTTGGPAAKQPVFDLTTRTGYIDLPDGNTAFMWGYSHGFDPFQHPGPVLCVHEGDAVTVILHNTLTVATSMVFPGQDDVRADGVPSQPQVATGGMMTSLAPGAAAATPTTQPTVTYTFTAKRAGTYLYEAGTDPETQVRMGLFGALIVRPPLDSAGKEVNRAYDSADSAFDPTEEFMVLLSEIDPYQHQAVERGKTFNITKYKARYWLINGRGYPDSIADNGASWLPNQPYGSLATVQPYDAVKHPLNGMARYLSVGSEDYPFHPHGNNGLVIGRDGRPLRNAAGDDLSMEKFAINIGPGQTWDVLFKWYDAEDYSPANPVTVTVPSLANQVVGTFYSGSPYLGSTQALPPGVQTLNQCGEYYIISHNHALYQITSWGVTMTGPITYMRIEPPTPNTCG